MSINFGPITQVLLVLLLFLVVVVILAVVAVVLVLVEKESFEGDFLGARAPL